MASAPLYDPDQDDVGGYAEPELDRLIRDGDADPDQGDILYQELSFDEAVRQAYARQHAERRRLAEAEQRVQAISELRHDARRALAHQERDQHDASLGGRLGPLLRRLGLATLLVATLGAGLAIGRTSQSPVAVAQAPADPRIDNGLIPPGCRIQDATGEMQPVAHHEDSLYHTAHEYLAWYVCPQLP